jgi:mono/diheme cytochrome c family protein
MKPSCLLFVVLACGLVQAPSSVQRATKLGPPRSNPFAKQHGGAAAKAKLFSRTCSYCHGQNGVGNGRKRTPPLTAGFVNTASPGTLFYVLENGSDNDAMSSFAYLPDPENSQIIAFLRLRWPKPSQE